MQAKRDNNLILIETADGNKYYFTSQTRAAKFGGFVGNSTISYFISRGTKFTLRDGREAKASYVDGSEIKYKYINNL